MSRLAICRTLQLKICARILAKFRFTICNWIATTRLQWAMSSWVGTSGPSTHWLGAPRSCLRMKNISSSVAKYIKRYRCLMRRSQITPLCSRATKTTHRFSSGEPLHTRHRKSSIWQWPISHRQGPWNQPMRTSTSITGISAVSTTCEPPKHSECVQKANDDDYDFYLLFLY